MKNLKKNILNIAFLLALMFLTFYMMLRDQELPVIWETVTNVNKGWLLLGMVLVVVFVCSESVIIWYMMKELQKGVPLKNCIKYSFIGFFFSCITPSATGGQPAQIYYMNKQKISVPVATLVLMIVTIMYKMVLVLIGFLVLFNRPFVVKYMGNTRGFLYLGLFLNVICIVAMLVLVFDPTMAKKIVVKLFSVLERFKFLKKKKEERKEKLIRSMDKYHETAAFFKSHRLVMFNVLLISIFQRLCLFFVTYCVYRAFGFHKYSMLEVVVLQAVISVAVDMLPLPGGIGASESLFMVIFRPIFGSASVLSAMLLSRGISYYGLLMISAVVTIYTHLTVGRNRVKGEGV